MKKMKKLVSLVLALVMCFCLALPTFAADYSFDDVEPDMWYTNAVERWSDASLINGYPNSNDFGVDKSITRAEVAKIMASMFGLTETGDVAFSDVSDDWYTEYVLACANAGIINGVGGTADANGNLAFQPDSNITREQAFKIVMEALLTDAEIKSYESKADAILEDFTDADEIGDWAEKYVAAIVDIGAVEGSGSKLSPTDPITRAQFATILDRLIAVYMDKDGNVSTYVPATNKENMVSVATYVVVNAANENIVVETGINGDGETVVIVYEVTTGEDGSEVKEEIVIVEVTAAESDIEVVLGQTGAIEKDEQVYTLTVTSHNPESSVTGEFLKAWAAEVEEASAGAIDIEIYHGATIAGPKDALDVVLNGTVDIAWGQQSYFAGQFPVTEVFALPCLNIASTEQVSDALWNFYNTYDYMDAEYSMYHVLYLHTGNQTALATVDKKISTISDATDMAIRITAGPPATFVTNIGASAEACSINHLYSNLDKGVYGGAIVDWDCIETYNLYETLSYILDENLGVTPYFMLMNKDSYAALPEELQTIIDEVSADAGKYTTLWDDCEDEVKAMEGVAEKLYTLSDTERAKLDAAAETTIASWIAGIENGQEIYDAAMKCIAEAKK